MAPSTSKGSWTPDEDRRLTWCVQTHGPQKWKTVATRAGLRRCGKSCRLRWLNYLRPNIKRGAISSAEEDLIFRLHTLLGNRWSLIAGRLPGRTDNEIKNYWNSHLSKKYVLKESAFAQSSVPYMPENNIFGSEMESFEIKKHEGGNSEFDVGTFLDFSEDRESMDFEWAKKFFEETDDKDLSNFSALK